MGNRLRMRPRRSVRLAHAAETMGAGNSQRDYERDDFQACGPEIMSRNRYHRHRTRRCTLVVLKAAPEKWCAVICIQECRRPCRPTRHDVRPRSCNTLAITTSIDRDPVKPLYMMASQGVLTTGDRFRSPPCVSARPALTAGAVSAKNSQRSHKKHDSQVSGPDTISLDRYHTRRRQCSTCVDPMSNAGDLVRVGRYHSG